ncbi:MAG: hypothetical protein ACLP3C_24985 [Mycobacterium sp.]|uniref:hypothetical protein n=1 Tax=Mycobacterium sp. TaxID=1785 RepID=UPI003F96F7F8
MLDAELTADDADDYFISGLYLFLFRRAIDRAPLTDHRSGVIHTDFAAVKGGSSEKDRQRLNATSPAVAAAVAKLRRFEAGEPMVITRTEMGGPDWPFREQMEGVPWLAEEARLTHDGAWTVRVFENDRVELLETRQQRDRRVADELLPDYHQAEQ